MTQRKQDCNDFIKISEVFNFHYFSNHTNSTAQVIFFFFLIFLNLHTIRPLTHACIHPILFYYFPMLFLLNLPPRNTTYGWQIILLRASSLQVIMALHNCLSRVVLRLLMLPPVPLFRHPYPFTQAPQVRDSLPSPISLSLNIPYEGYFFQALNSFHSSRMLEIS